MLFSPLENLLPVNIPSVIFFFLCPTCWRHLIHSKRRKHKASHISKIYGFFLRILFFFPWFIDFSRNLISPFSTSLLSPHISHFLNRCPTFWQTWRTLCLNLQMTHSPSLPMSSKHLSLFFSPLYVQEFQILNIETNILFPFSHSWLPSIPQFY